MSHDLTVLATHRAELLLAEVAAWLHMLGKYHEDFLRGNHDLDIQIPPDLTTNYPQMDSLLRDSWPGPIWERMGVPGFNAVNLSLFSLAEGHRNRQASKGLVRLMWDAHGRGSGIEKGVLERFAPGQQTIVYPATALGSELDSIDLAKLQARRTRLYVNLEQWLQKLRESGAAVDWGVWRRTFLESLKENFRATVAETRRPMNDITLFDQTVASVAMLKAALAQNLVMGWKEPIQAAVADKYQWRFLRVAISGPTFWGSAARLSDMLARRALIVEALNRVEALLEETYPLGMEVYRDENGSLFIVPDIDSVLDLPAEDRSLRSHLIQIAETALDGEARFTLELSQPTRNMLMLGQLATRALPDPTSTSEWLAQIWRKTLPNDICPVCGLRPQGPGDKAAERKVCNTCEQRRADRSKKWAADLRTTIWTDEVADINSRFALIVGAFGVENWLSGSAFNSVLMFDPSTCSLNDPGRKNRQYNFDYSVLLQDIQGAARRNQFVGNTLLDNLVLRAARDGGFFQFYDIQVTDSDLAGFGPHPRAEILALAMLRQNPSFARLRRVWETTRSFWQEIQDDFSNTVKVVGERLAIYPKEADALDLGLFHTYELNVDGAHLSVVWDSDGRRFITCDNLKYLGKPAQLGRPVAEVVTPDRTLALEEPAGYGGADRSLGDIQVERVETLPGRYVPAIPILAEPRTFMALVPADRALAVVQAIQAKYEREMGKVRNRLPLTLGMVYAGRRQPLASALDAGRRMLRRRPQTAQAIVEDVSPVAPWPQQVELTLKMGERSIQVSVPTVMGDGTTADVWYPYWQVGGKPTDRSRWFVGPDGEHWVHVCDLHVGDVVAFTPSSFDFELLDASARRFEVVYGDDGQRLGTDKRQRPYLLEQVDDLEDAWTQISRLSVSQIKALESLIEAKRRDWNEPLGAPGVSAAFRQFVADALREAGIHTASLEEAAVTGMLADALEIHLTIHKEKPS